MHASSPAAPDQAAPAPPDHAAARAAPDHAAVRLRPMLAAGVVVGTAVGPPRQHPVDGATNVPIAITATRLFSVSAVEQYKRGSPHWSQEAGGGLSSISDGGVSRENSTQWPAKRSGIRTVILWTGPGRVRGHQPRGTGASLVPARTAGDSWRQSPGCGRYSAWTTRCTPPAISYSMRTVQRQGWGNTTRAC